MYFLNPYAAYFLAFFAALIISLFSVPNIIYIARRKHLVDVPDNHRKLHARVVPNLGGVGIFFAFFLVSALLIEPLGFLKWNYLAAACLVLFITGLKDDLVAISPTKKFIAQAMAATITVVFADVRLHSLGGLFGIYELPDSIAIPFSIVGCIFVTNAFNLLDGIDGLAGTIGVYITVMLGLFLAAYGRLSEAVMAFAMAGALVGFLRFNLAPAKIFMGDTGSLIIGFVVSMLSIFCINTYHPGGTIDALVGSSSAVFLISLAILCIPVFDTFRVFLLRIARGHSPFHADRTHLHHYLLDLGLSHTRTVGVILAANVAVTALAIGLQGININAALAILLVFMLGLYALLLYLRRSHAQHSAATITSRFKTKQSVINKGIRLPGTVVAGGEVVSLESEQGILSEANAG
ncbi:MAG: undecaprenyl/decaprenyl-phosphate alpha-N-acetylglucosaminyl 1-phosphate transferase [Bacteroidetes bacterium]|nr:undecaprenyl/decaprenyl-phosphate alpha-N-acetylglucosaminyl 1-phosphate transferase [Bacteroidota bacterium]